MVLQDTITREIKQEARDRIIKELDAIVAEFGYDYVYPHARLDETGISKCMYVEHVLPERFEDVFDVDLEDLKPSCIISQLATRLGVTLEQLLAYNTDSVDQLMMFVEIPYARHFEQELTDLQYRQDTGMCWGKAVDLFKQETNRVGETAA